MLNILLQNLVMDSAQPRKMLKRKHSTGDSLTHPIHRFRTFSEPRIEAATTIIRETLPEANIKVATQSMGNVPNSLRVANGDLSLLGSEMIPDHMHHQPNPLYIAQDELQRLQLFHDTSIVPQGAVPFNAFASTKDENPSRGSVEDEAVSPSPKAQLSPDRDVSEEVSEPSEQQHESSTMVTKTYPLSGVGPTTHSSEIRRDLVDPGYSNKSSLINYNEPAPGLELPPASRVEIPPDEMMHSQTAPKVVQPIPSNGNENPLGSTDDEKFLEQVKVVLKNQGKWKTANVGRRSARRIGQVLELVKPPNASEALFPTGDNAARQLECGSFFPGPIITENQQPLPLQSISQFLGEFYDDSAEVWIQDPAILLARNIPHARDIKIGQLKQRFLAPAAKARIPWNCLEMATHVEDGLRPAFLNNEDCRLLTKLKIPGSADNVARRAYDPGWKEVEKWALLAQGGALTEPHQDSHGYGTYITMNEGTMGFGWLSNPTKEERTGWLDDPATFTGGRWRFVVLKPGQTVYFPSGTVHFVFRLASMGDTLAFGGHVLRCSQIVRWAEVMLEEQANRGITNEDLTVSAPAYLERVEKFVTQALATGEVERWGGVEAIETFLRLKAEFMSGSSG